ncbi:DUF4013 domain-containing protein [Thalassoglobus polymorphus]|uniref:DUF4013 domain-containing protein n=1 Tax=Thalassoglobus polymorphus TaxID=2527994 RepID=A0A517QTT0_9PLAN|nr:DUF4013 domain-containing protein [Thalassoglobus polymorphus]QDT35054.1 hypothetical protein Mal48_43280 [Thalassoglobus polymorphus]
MKREILPVISMQTSTFDQMGESPFDSEDAAESPPTKELVTSEVNEQMRGTHQPEEVAAAGPTAFPVPWRHPIKFLALTTYYLFAFVSLMLVLAVLAAIPLVNFFVLGYFLNVEGRVARSGRLRDGFPLLDAAPQIVVLAGGIWVFLLPLRFLASFAADSRLIDPGSQADVGFHLALNVAWCVITLHLILAIARGGTFWCFVRPFKNFFWLTGRLREGNYFAHADRKIQEFVQKLEIRRHFWLGLRGFGVAFLWLFLPTLMYAAIQEPKGGQIFLTVTGGILLAVVFSWVPFLQARFASENCFRSGLELREIRSLYSYAPIVWSLSLVVLYLLSLPLYLFKAFLLPPDAMWPVTLIFVVSIYPTRILLGWAYHHAVKKRELGNRPHWSVRWLIGGTIIPVLGLYVFILFFTQFLGEQGKQVLFQHHSLLLPVPF